jgi:hypothetical protein
MFRKLSEEFLWTPQQIGRLTLPQVMLYLGKGEKTKTMSAAQVAAMRATKAKGNASR